MSPRPPEWARQRRAQPTAEARSGFLGPQRFWISVADALRDTAGGATLVRAVTAAPDLDGWAVVERMLADLARCRTGPGW
jgi:hypothetical protein